MRHFLVGSPSGYSWTEQVIPIKNFFQSPQFKVETILTHEEGWRHWEGIPTEIKMLPKYKRVALLEARRQNKLLNNGELMLELTKDSEQQEQIEGGEMDKQQQQIVCG